MALPKLQYPSYKCTVPSTGELVTYHPFTVADEKLLLTAAEANSIDEMVDSTNNLIKSCVSGIKDYSKLTTYDIDYLFLQLRIKSISPTAEQFYKNMECTKTGGECDKTLKITINLEDVEVKQWDGEAGEYKKLSGEKSKNIVMLDDVVGVTLKYPTQKERGMEFFKEDYTEDDMIKACIVTVFDADNVYQKGEDFTDEEFDSWYSGLSSKSKAGIKQFLENIPVLHYETSFVCKECGFTEKITFDRLEDFFG